MKRVLLSAFIISSLFIACKGPKDKIVIKDENGDKVASVSVNEASKKMEETANKAEELKKLAPLSLDQVKALIPNELLGMPRANFDANAAGGYASAKGTYKGEGDKQLDIEIIDCAGEMGSLIYNTRFFAFWNYQHEDDNGYEKTIDFNGGKAVEKYNKSDERYELTSFANDRFIVHVEGEKVPLDDIKKLSMVLT